MNLQSFAKLYTQLSKLLSELTDEELSAAVEGKAMLALSVEYKGAAKKLGGATAKKAKSPSVSVEDLMASLRLKPNRTDALNLLDQKSVNLPILKKIAKDLSLPATGKKPELASRIANHIGWTATAEAIRNS